MKDPRVIFQPDVYSGLRRGSDQIANALRPTLGPLARTIAIDPVLGDKPPEILDDGGTIARRIFQLPNRNEDVGAMLLRHMLWKLHESVGDGTVTAAIIFQSVFHEGIRYITAGGNPMRLRKFLELGLETIDVEIAQHIAPVTEMNLEQAVRSLCPDPQIAPFLVEAFGILGEYGQLDILEGGQQSIFELAEGLYWEGGSLIQAEGQPSYRTSLSDAAILISDFDLQEAKELAEFIAEVIRTGKKSLLIIANSLSVENIHLLKMVNSRPGFRVLAAKPPHLELLRRTIALADLAVLTGGQVCVQGAGQSLKSVRMTQLGAAQVVWSDRRLAGIINGAGDPRAIRVLFHQLQATYRNSAAPDEQKRLRERIATLMGGFGILHVGGVALPELEHRRDAVKRAVDLIRAALRDGILVGGGITFLACAEKMLTYAHAACDSDERAAYMILSHALSKPFEAILQNAGYESGVIRDQVQRNNYQVVFDVECGQLAAPTIFDSAKVLRAVINHSIGSAALSLTIGVVVHRKGYEKDQPGIDA